MEDNKKLAKETLRELRAAKERVTKDGGKCPVELDHRIKMYAGGYVKHPRDFDSEIRHITHALMIEESDFRYNPSIKKFVNGRGEIASSIKEATEANIINDKKRRTLEYKIPDYRNKDREIALNISLGRPPEFVETQPVKNEYTPRPVVFDSKSVEEIINEKIKIKNNTTGLAALIGKKII